MIGIKELKEKTKYWNRYLRAL